LGEREAQTLNPAPRPLSLALVVAVAIVVVVVTAASASASPFSSGGGGEGAAHVSPDGVPRSGSPVRSSMTTRITPGVGANLLGQHAAERNQDATAYVGNLDSQVT
jgi:hypothetical protein